MDIVVYVAGGSSDRDVVKVHSQVKWPARCGAVLNCPVTVMAKANAATGQPIGAPQLSVTWLVRRPGARPVCGRPL